MGKKTQFLEVFLIGFLVIMPTTLLGNRGDRFESLTVRDGLSHNSVYCIFQDSMGMLWIGTQGGLNRYDGYTFKVYTSDINNPDSLISAFIYTIYESPREPGILWIGTAAGLCRFDLETERFTSFRNNSCFGNWLKNEAILKIIEDPDGCLWLGTFGEGLIRLNQSDCSYLKFKNTPLHPHRLGNNNITDMALDLRGNIWIGSDGGGLSKFNIKKETFKLYRAEKGNPNSIKNNWILTLFCDQTGDIWVGTNGSGITQIHLDKNGNETFSQLKHEVLPTTDLKNNHIKEIYQDSRGKYWISTSGGGLYILKNETKKFEYFPYSPNHCYNQKYYDIKTIFEDSAGSLWFGTYGGGLKKLKNQKIFKHYNYDPINPYSIKHNEIWDFLQGEDNTYWIATNGGLYRFDMANGTFHLLHHNLDSPEYINYNQIFCICKDFSGNLWLGSDGGGLYKYHPQKNRFYHYPFDPNNEDGISQGVIRTILMDNQGVLWVGTRDRGLCCLYPDKRENMKFRRFSHIPEDSSSLPNNRVINLIEDPTGTIWICTWGGDLCRFQRKTETFSYFNNNNSIFGIAKNKILTLHFDSKGYMWIATTMGLFKFESLTKEFTHYSIDDGLPDNIIYDIQEEDPIPGESSRNFWLSTNKGLSRFNPETEEFRNYDVRDGLQANEFNIGSSLKSKKGLMFFGGINGFNVFNPKELHINRYIPPVVITDFHIFYKPVPIDPKGNSPLKKSIMKSHQLQLKYNQNSFSFQFAALNYIDPEKNQYAYILEGFDREWVYIKEKHLVSYTNVPPGEYTFRVKGSNNDGIWNNKGVSISMSIHPPYWQVWWFKALIITLLIIAYVIFYKIRTTVLKQKMEKRRLENELELKADFTAMLVHDLRSPLTAVIGYAELLSEYSKSLDVEKAGSIIANSSNKMLTLINDMLDLSKFEAGKMNLNQQNVDVDRLNEVISDIIELLKPLMNQKMIELNWKQLIHQPPNKKILQLDLEKIGQVIHNLISNAIKFSPAHSRISINCCYINGQFLEISVNDQGAGIPVERQKNLFDKYAQIKSDKHAKGTGLGLAVSKLIIDSHDGIIEYRKGENNGGSTFFFRLPLKNY